MALADIDTALQTALARDPNHISALLVTAAPLDWFLREMLGDTAITYAARPQVTLDAARQRLDIQGRCTFLAYRDVDLTITLVQTTPDIVTRTLAVLPAGAVFQLPGLGWFTIGDLRMELESAWSWDRSSGTGDLKPIEFVRAALLGNLRLAPVAGTKPPDIRLPVRIDTLPGQSNQWLLSLDASEHIGLPDVGALSALLGGFSPDRILPDAVVAFLEQIRVEQFAAGWDGEQHVVTTLSVTLAALDQPWEVVAGHLSVARPTLTLIVDSPLQGAARTVRALVSGTIGLQLSRTRVDVPVEVAVSRDMLSLRLGGTEPIALPEPADLAAMMFGSDVAAALPPQFQVTGLAVDEFFVSYDVARQTLALVAVEVGADIWQISPHLAVRNLDLRIEAATPLAQPHFQLGMSAIIKVGDTAVPVALGRGEGAHWGFEVARIELPSIAEVLRSLGGDALVDAAPGLKRLGGVTLEKVSLEFSGHKIGAISATVSGVHDWQPIASLDALVVNGVAVQVAIQSDATGKPTLTGRVTGKATVMGATLDLDVALAEQLTLSFGLTSLSLFRLIRQLLGNDTALPLVPDVTIEQLTVTTRPADDFLQVTSDVAARGDLSIGENAHFSFSSIHFEYTREAARTHCAIRTEGSCTLPEGLALDHFGFDFSYHDGAWSAMTAVEVALFGTKADFDAEYTTSPGEQNLKIALHTDEPWQLFSLDGMALSVASPTLHVKKQQTITWDFTAGATLTLPRFEPIAGQLEVANDFVEFRSPHQFTLPIVPDHGVALQTTFQGVRISWPDWRISCTTTLELSGLPRLLHDYHVLPAHVELSAGLTEGEFSFDIKLTDVIELQDFTIPDVVLSAAGEPVVIPLSHFKGARFGVQSLGVSIGDEVALVILFRLVLPSNINDIFGTHDGQPRLELFSTDPIDIEFRLGLLEDGSVGISFGCDTPPILTQYVKPDLAARRWDIDFGSYGAVSMAVPTFKLDALSFGSDGKVTVTRQLGLPLKPLQLLLAHWLGDAARARALIPDTLPIEKFSIDDVLDRLKHDHPDLGDAIDAIKGAIDKLPGRLHDYLEFDPPQQFGWHIHLRADASAELGFTCDPPVRVLFPMPPALCGFTFRGLSFGPVLGGSLFQLKLNCDFDQFDLLSLAIGVALPDDPQLLLRRDFHRSVLIEDLFMIIVYETVVPLPIPIFFTSLGVEHVGIEGLDLEAHAAFPAPTLQLAELARAFMQFRKFAVDPDYHLQAADVPDSILPHFSLSRCFAQLPPFISKDAYLGNKQENFFPPPPPLSQHIVDLLNTIKFISINDVIHLLPIDERVGQYLLSAGDDRHPVLGFLGLVTADCEWLLATPWEFLHDSACQRVGVDATEAKHLLATTGKEVTQDMHGVILLLKAGVAVGKLAGVGVRLCLVSINGAGFATGFRVGGMVGELQLMLGAALEINKAAKRFDATGDASLTFVDQIIFDGQFDVHVGADGFALHGSLQLLPDDFPLHAGGHVIGVVNARDGVLIDAGVSADLGVVTLIGAHAHISPELVRLDGAFLGSSLSLRYQITPAAYVFESLNTILPINMNVMLTCLRKGGVTTGFHADILGQMAFDARFVLPSRAQDVATLTMFGLQVFTGWIKPAVDGFAIGGSFKVFPPGSPMQFVIEAHGTLDAHGLRLGGSNKIGVLGVTLQVAVSINNGLPAMSGGVTVPGVGTLGADFGLCWYHNVAAFCAAYHVPGWFGGWNVYMAISPKDFWVTPFRPRDWPLKSVQGAPPPSAAPVNVERLTEVIVNLGITREVVSQLLLNGPLTSWTEDEASARLPHLAYYDVEIRMRDVAVDQPPDWLIEVTLNRPPAERALTADLFGALRLAAGMLLPDTDDSRRRRLRGLIESLEHVQFSMHTAQPRAMVLLVAGAERLGFEIELDAWDVNDWLQRALAEQ